MLKGKPLVSAIIIFLNAEKYIEEAIESVLAQTYDNWELWLVDDGSTDASTRIARRYATQNPQQICYLEHPDHENRGMSASRNLGIYHATGSYVAFLDADDVWLPDKLEVQVHLLEAHPEAAMLYGNTLYWHSWAGKAGDELDDYIPELGVEPNSIVEPPLLLPLYLTGKAAVPCICSILVRREALERIGGFEESFQGMYEDQAFYAKMCLAEPIFVSGECLDRYRQHPDSSVAIASRAMQAANARQFFLKWLAKYLVEHGITDSATWQAVKKELWLGNQPVWLPRTGRMHRIVRWIKKWILRVQERILPPVVGRWLLWR